MSAIGWSLVLIVWLMPSASAGQGDVDRANALVAERGEAGLSTAETAQLSTRGWRDRRPGERRPPVSRLVRPADYRNDVHRGTIEFDPSWRNYSYHTVRIPDGTTVTKSNFSQIAPLTEAIVGRNLTFIECNLVNVQTHDDWTIIHSNTAQIDRVGSLATPDAVVIEDEASVYLGPNAKSVDPLRLKPAGVIE